jgi:hypothetical protein
MIHLLLIFTVSETFKQTSQTILQSDSNLIKNYFSKITKIFIFLDKSETVPNLFRLCLFIIAQIRSRYRYIDLSIPYW